MQSIKRIVTTLLFAIFIHIRALEAAWSPPVQISAGLSSLNLGTTPLVIDNNSVALVGWLDGNIGVAQTLSSASLFPQFNVWTTPQIIYNNTTPGLFPSFPTMAVDIFGNQIAGFGVIDPMSIESFILNASRRSVETTNWQPPITQVENGNPFGGSSLAIGNLGNFAALLALSTTGGTPPFNITLVQLPANSSSWLSPLVFAQDNSTQPAVAAKTREGNATLAWKVNTPTLQIQTARFDFLTQQLSSIINVPLPPLTTDILGMDIAVDSQGDSILIYAAQIGSNFILYSSTLLAGQNTWTAPILISNPTNEIIGASIASDAVGNSTIFWGEQITPTQQFVRVATLPLGGLPILVTDLTSPTNLNTTVDASSRVAMDLFGNAVAIWGITTSGVPMIQVSSKAIGQGWTPPETLSVFGIAPLVTLSDQGTAVATWLDNASNVLMGSRNLYLFALMPPSNFIGKIIENISPQGDSFFLVTTWIPSPAPNIVSFEIYQNEILIGTAPGEGPFTFVQPLSSGNISGIYTLIAVASNGNRSLPISLMLQPSLAPPSHFIGKVLKNEFATQKVYFLDMQWTPSPANNIDRYEIFKNGRVIATIPRSGPFKFLQSLHSKQVKGKYVIVAIAADGSKSFSVPLAIKKKD